MDAGHEMINSNPIGIDRGGEWWATRLEEIAADLMAELGGERHIGAAKRALVRRAAVMILEIELRESRFAESGCVDPRDFEIYSRATGQLRRLLNALSTAKVCP